MKEERKKIPINSIHLFIIENDMLVQRTQKYCVSYDMRGNQQPKEGNYWDGDGGMDRGRGNCVASWQPERWRSAAEEFWPLSLC
jgi:hypothetical protein